MITIRETKDYQSVLTLWNQEVGFIYPLDEEVFSQNLINYPYKVVYGAYNDTQLVGFIVGKTWDGDIMSELNDKAWISLFYVARKYRRCGIGSQLLTQLETTFNNKSEMNVGRDINAFFPGIPCDFDNLTDTWFEKRGYISGKYTHDLVNRNPSHFPIKNKRYLFREGKIEDKEQFLAWIYQQFGIRWHYEAYQYFEKGGTGKEYVFAFDDNKLIAFCRINDQSFNHFGYNMTWRKRFALLGGVGPLGVDKVYRGKQLGYDIVAYGINTLIKRGIQEIIIDWTGLLDFYQQFGFEVWKSFKYMSKKR